MPDFVKSNDQELRAQLIHYHAVVSVLPANYGLTAADLAAIQDLIDLFGTALDQHVSFQDAARAKTDAKNATRDAVVAVFRSQNAIAQADPDVTAAQKQAAGLPVHDETRTPGTAPTARPELQVTVNGQEHRITVLDSDNHRPARPAEARFIELYRAVVTPGQPLPTNIDQMTLVGVFTASRFTVTYTGSDIGKTVVYIARYVGSKNQFGPAGTTTAASIAA